MLPSGPATPPRGICCLPWAHSKGKWVGRMGVKLAEQSPEALAQDFASQLYYKHLWCPNKSTSKHWRLHRRQQLQSAALIYLFIAIY